MTPRPAAATYAVWICFALALLLRVGCVSWVQSQAGAKLSYSDEELHWQLATHLARSGTLVSDDGRMAARMPAYPFFLSYFAPLGDAGVLAARLTQALLGAVTAGLAAWFAFRVLGSRAAWLAGLIVAVDPFAILLTTLLLSETLLALLLLYAVAAAWTVSQARRWSDVSVTHLLAASLGLALLKPEALGVVALLLIWLIFFSAVRRAAPVSTVAAPVERPAAAAGTTAGIADRGPLPPNTAGALPTRRVALLTAASAVLLIAVALAAWSQRNREALGVRVWLSTNGGVTLFDGQGPQARGDSDQTFLQRIPELAGLNEVERDRWLARAAAEHMRADPARVLRLAGVKFARMWSPWPNVAEYRSSLAGLAGALFSVALYALAAVGLWRTRRDRAFVTLLVIPIVYFTLVYCLFIGSVRYRVPLTPLLAVAAGARSPARSSVFPALISPARGAATQHYDARTRRGS